MWYHSTPGTIIEPCLFRVAVSPSGRGSNPRARVANRNNKPKGRRSVSVPLESGVCVLQLRFNRTLASGGHGMRSSNLECVVDTNIVSSAHPIVPRWGTPYHGALDPFMPSQSLVRDQPLYAPVLYGQHSVSALRSLLSVDIRTSLRQKEWFSVVAALIFSNF